MIVFKRCTSKNADFTRLTKELHAELAFRNGELQHEYNQYNGIDNIATCIIAYENSTPVGCGCFKKYSEETIEMKRVFVSPPFRGKGIAGEILRFLEGWALELGYRKAVLETGKKQAEAIYLYEKNGYLRTENYGPYAKLQNSVCFMKNLDV